MKLQSKLNFYLSAVVISIFAVLSLLQIQSSVNNNLEQIQQKLSAVSQSKVERIQNFLHNRTENLRLIGSRTQLRLSLAQLNQANSTSEINKIARILNDALKSSEAIEELQLFNLNGKPVFDNFTEQRQNRLSILHAQSAGNGISFLKTADNQRYLKQRIALKLKQKTIGYLVGYSNLYPLLKSLTNYTQIGFSTADVVLVHYNSQNQTHFINTPRFSPELALTATPTENRFSFIAAKSEPLDKTIEAFDYRGVAVIARVVLIPEYSLGLSIELDKSEVNRLSYQNIEATTLLMLLLLALSLVATNYFSRRLLRPLQTLSDSINQQAQQPTLKTLPPPIVIEGDNEFSQLAERYNELMQNQQAQLAKINLQRDKYHSLMNLSSEALFLMDSETGCLIEYSKQTQKFLGYSDREMRSLCVLDWDKGFHSIEDYRNLTANIGYTPVNIEREHTRKDGSTYIGAISAIRITLDGRDDFYVSVRDITEQKRHSALIARQRDELKAITDSSQEAILMINHNGEITFWNPAANRIFGYTETEAIGKDLHSLLVPERYLPAFRLGFEHFLQTGEGNVIGKQIDIQAIHKEGHEISIDLSISAMHINDQWHAVGLIRDNTEKKATEALILQQKNQLEAIFDTALEGIAVLDLDTQYLQANEKYSEILGYEHNELIGKHCYEFTAPESRQESLEIYQLAQQQGAVENYELTCITKQGEPRRINSSIRLMPDKQHYLVTSSDVTERHRLLQRIQEQSITDELTQLMNRKALQTRLHELIALYHRQLVDFSLLLLDIDHFKNINDTFGHHAGDEVLVAISQQMLTLSRKTDYVYRFGGEEFIILLTGTNLNGAQHFAEKLRSTVQQNLKVMDDSSQQQAITISIGVTQFHAEDNYDSLLKRADKLLYQAKRNGRNQVAVD